MAPTMALPPKKGPSGFRFTRFDWNWYTLYAKAAAKGKPWSVLNSTLQAATARTRWSRQSLLQDARQVAGDSQGQTVRRGCAAATALWRGLFPSSTCVVFAGFAMCCITVTRGDLLPSHQVQVLSDNAAKKGRPCSCGV